MGAGSFVEKDARQAKLSKRLALFVKLDQDGNRRPDRRRKDRYDLPGNLLRDADGPRARGDS